MNEPTVIVTIRRMPLGEYSAELAGHAEALSAPDLGSLLDKIRHAYQENGAAEIDEDDVDDESFERDLERVLTEDRELLDRLAR